MDMLFWYATKDNRLIIFDFWANQNSLTFPLFEAFFSHSLTFPWLEKSKITFPDFPDRLGTLWPYISWFSSQTQNRFRKLSTSYCININILLPFSSFKIGSYLNVKDLIPNGLRSCVVYKFSCASWLVIWRRQPDISAHEQNPILLKTDKAFYIYKHLHGADTCLSDCSEECFKIIHLASTAYNLKIKEALHILWENLTLNTQV